MGSVDTRSLSRGPAIKPPIRRWYARDVPDAEIREPARIARLRGTLGSPIGI
jgi:hypothetical protein